MLAVEKAKIDLSTEHDRRRPQGRAGARAAPEPGRGDRPRRRSSRLIMPLVRQVGHGHRRGAEAARHAAARTSTSVLLVGGTSKIPLIRRFVTEKLAGKEPEPFDKVDPMTCVAQGAAIVSAILQGAPGLDNYAYSVKLEHSLCANPINERPTGLPRPDHQARQRHPLLVHQDVLPRGRPGRARADQRLRGRRLRRPGQPGERQAGGDPLGVQAAAAAARRRPGGDVRVRRRRHPDGADQRPVRRPEEAVRHPADRRGPARRRRRSSR